MNADHLAPAIGLLFWTAASGLVWHQTCGRRAFSTTTRVAGWTLVIPLAFVLRGALGEVGPVLLALIASRHFPGAATPRVRAVFLVYGAGGLVLFASALGLFGADFYGFGYQAKSMVLFAAGLCSLVFFVWPPLAWAGALALLLSTVVSYPSANLWDGLIDVPSATLALYFAFRRQRTA